MPAEVLFERPQADFVFPLLNRAGFLNSEMLCPLLCTRLGLPFVGIFFSNLPALDAQTRLLTGRYLEYRVTEKA